jgi:predicted secreted protein
MTQSLGRCMAGTKISFASLGAPAVFTELGEAFDIQRSGAKRETDDTTNHDSTSGYRETCPTIKEPGEWSVDYNFVPGDDGQAALSALYESGDRVNWQVVLPDSLGEFTFTAFVMEYGNFKFPVDKKASGSVKIKVTGPVVENFGS